MISVSDLQTRSSAVCPGCEHRRAAFQNLDSDKREEAVSNT